jgi:hypothetical protein
MSVLKWQILLPVFPRLVLIAFTICQPFLVNSLLAFLQQTDQQQTVKNGYGLIGAYGLVYIGMAVSSYICII